jgi:hypothetical protein
MIHTTEIDIFHHHQWREWTDTDLIQTLTTEDLYLHLHVTHTLENEIHTPDLLLNIMEEVEEDHQQCHQLQQGKYIKTSQNKC